MKPKNRNGKRPPKREDRALLLGQGQFADDIALTAPLHIAFVRAQSAGHLQAVNADDAHDMPGVHATYTGADLRHLDNLSINPVIDLPHTPEFPVLAPPGYVAVGQPIAAIVAETPAQAQDAADMIAPDIDDAPHVPKTIATKHWTKGDTAHAFDTADHIVNCTIQHPRLAPAPMEPRAIAISYNATDDTVAIWQSTQTPHRTRSELASILGINPDRIRVIAQHVGGAFGMKASLYPEEVFAVWAAIQHKRAVKWIATRSDDFLSATHGRGITTSGKLALNADGQFTALQAQVHAPLGGWLPNSALIPAWNAARILPSGYRIENIDITTTATTDGRGPTGIYRGAGRPEANALIERLIDKAADATGLDAIEIRRRNLLTPADLPHDTATGNRLDSGDYARALDMLAQAVDLPSLRDQQTKRRAKGELVGIGIGFYVEPSGEGWESARVTLNGDRATVASGSSSQGHGRETTFAQIAADTLGLDPAKVDVNFADTDKTPAGIGALASRSTAIGGSAVAQACTEIKAEIDALRKAQPKYSQNTATLQPVEKTAIYHNLGQAWGYGAYLAMVTICRDTGALSIDQIACVDDAGTLINPDLVHGQITGGIAQGLGEAVMEHVEFDVDNQLLTGSLMDYALPRASDMPPIAIHSLQTPSPMNILGAKGVGEAGTIGAPIAILNACVDALKPLGIADLQMPLTSCNIWNKMHSAAKGSSQ